MKRAIAIARMCGFRGEAACDVASEIEQEWRRCKLNRLRVAALVCKRALADTIGVPQRQLPSDLCRLSAIASHHNAKCDYEEADMSPSFDYHDRQFAANNGVCPRCSSSKGKFDQYTGECPCGFNY